MFPICMLLYVPISSSYPFWKLSMIFHRQVSFFHQPSLLHLFHLCCKAVVLRPPFTIILQILSQCSLIFKNYFTPLIEWSISFNTLLRNGTQYGNFLRPWMPKNVISLLFYLTDSLHAKFYNEKNQPLSSFLKNYPIILSLASCYCCEVQEHFFPEL